MATRALCSVVDCGKRHYARGYCRNHHHRHLTHGDPLGGKAAQGEPLSWLTANLNHAGDACLIWPFGCFPNGYGLVSWEGVTTHASRVMCLLAHGEPPADRPFSLHSCNGGHLGCVHPAHVHWGTQAENMQDSVDAGTRARGERQHAAKLTEDAVREIRSSSTRPGVLADRFGVHPDTITRVRKRQGWAWLE